MNRLRNRSTIWLLNVALAACFSIGAVKVKPPPDFPENGATLDVSGWHFRKGVGITRPGAQQIQLDLDVLSRAQRDLEDLRLMRGDEQVPYIIESTSITSALTPIVTVTNQTKPPAFTRWTLKLPQRNLPLARLTCVARTPVFQRDMTLYEFVIDERGENYHHTLGAYNTTWTQTPDRKNKEFTVTLSDFPKTDTLFLETRNGDNPPIELENFRLFYPVKRVLFNAKPGDELFLYYGNPYTSPPHYDLSLVANELVAANKATASLGPEEQLKKTSWAENRKPGKGGVVFWGILAVVVAVLLVIISRLLPKSDAQPPR